MTTKNKPERWTSLVWGAMLIAAAAVAFMYYGMLIKDLGEVRAEYGFKRSYESKKVERLGGWAQCVRVSGDSAFVGDFKCELPDEDGKVVSYGSCTLFSERKGVCDHSPVRCGESDPLCKKIVIEYENLKEPISVEYKVVRGG